MRILGISAYYHDSAAALVEDGRIVAAAQEERFTRKKHDSGFPRHAVHACLAEAGASLRDVDFVVFYDKPFIKFERLVETYLAWAPRGFLSFRTAMPAWLKEKLFQKSVLEKALKQEDSEFDRSKLLFTEHHLSHAASAFYPSPFEEAVVLTLDGVGEWTTTSVGFGKGKTLAMQRELHFPHSLGLLYSAFTYYTGFKVNSGEYKVMGLAPYGERDAARKYADLILREVMDLKEDGTFRLNQKYFNYCTGLTMTNGAFAELFGGPARKPDKELLVQRHMDLAAAVQIVTEETMLRLARSLSKQFDCPNLCMAGGVALNCVANGKILRERPFKNLWIQPAAGDAGGALGAALAAYHGFADKPRVVARGLDAMQGSYLGPRFKQSEVERRLKTAGARFEVLSDDEVISRAAEALASEKAVGWSQGRMEFGPRALGARSILGDPRSPTMQKTLNLRVKYRESFRPFAPSVLRERVSDYFEMDDDSPYMLLVADVVKSRRIPMSKEQEKLFGIDKLNVPRSDVPAITHVDYSARVQTVHKETNPRYHRLLSEFEKRTGCPVLVNTSFNVRGEPIVCTPEDAFRCFMGCEIEALVVENCFLRKEDQDPALKLDYKSAFELD
ncbi:MAG: carbamoyltransferase [Phycisphaerae bacterium]|nr:carbamoyltransferase [Phycisphaerae bacterium]